MPELAASYVLGLICTLLLTSFFYFSILRKNSSVQTRTLQNNLAKASSYWSISEGRILAGSPEDLFKDQKKMAHSVLLFGALFSFLSWLGLVFLTLMIVSMKFLAVSRIEKIVFSSELAKAPDLSPAQIDVFLTEIQNQTRS